MRAKSISCEDLNQVGAKVSEFLQAKSGKALGEARIGLFPDDGIFGGERVLDEVGQLDVREIAELSTAISREILSPAFEVSPTVIIKDRILIFGGEIAPDIFIGR